MAFKLSLFLEFLEKRRVLVADERTVVATKGDRYQQTKAERWVSSGKSL